MHLGPGRLSRGAVLARHLGAFSVCLAVLGTLAHRAGLAEGVASIAVLGAFLSCALLSFLLGLISLVRIWREGYDGTRDALIGLALSSVILIIPVSLLPAALSAPRLYQATTDFADPPAFVWAARARPKDANPIDKLPADQEIRQTEAFASVVPLRVDLTPVEAYQLALQLAERRGWRVLDRRPPQNRIPGRIEAVARTRFYGFQDDVVIRVTPAGNEARVDMRSASRIGVSDLGSNARRIIEFLTELRDRAVER